MSTEDFERYIESLNAGTALGNQVEDAIKSFKFLCGSEPDRIFVSNTLDVSGEIVFPSVWGFRDGYWMEARVQKDGWDVDISSYSRALYYVGIEYRNLELPGEVTEASRMLVEIQTARTAYSNLSAVGFNCSELIEIVEKLFLPNLRDQP